MHDFEYTYTFSKRTPFELSSKLENIGFTTIQRAANDRAYSTRQHFAMLALLHAASHSRFRVAVRDAYRQRLQHEFHVHTKASRALERLFKGARIYESRSSKMYFALCHSFDIQDLNAEQLQYIPKVVLLRMYGDYIGYV